jgi:citrate/tricarballylate utilization protein
VLGAAGGVSLLLGAGGLVAVWTRNAIRRTAMRSSSRWTSASWRCSSSISLSGLALWLARATAAMPALLAIHLGGHQPSPHTTVGKFAHRVFRVAALTRYG